MPENSTQFDEYSENIFEIKVKILGNVVILSVIADRIGEFIVQNDKNYFFHKLLLHFFEIVV